MNDILHCAKLSKVYTFADDTTLVMSHTTIDGLMADAEAELTRLLEYFYENNLKANADKTLYTVFLPRPKPNTFEITVFDTTIKHTESAN